MFPLSEGKSYVTVVDVCVVRIDDALISRSYLMYLINSPRIRNAIEEYKTGSTRKRISRRNLAKVELPVASLPEQRRIVAKIEELFSEIDKGVESLQTAKAQLQVYRQALLKHAFEGKLTAQWRADNPDKVVPAAQLLTQIQQAREERYQQQLEEWKTAVEKWELGGKEGKKPSKPKKLEALEIISAGDALCSATPDSWLWLRYGSICEVVRNGISQKPEGNQGTKIFRISAVRPMSFDMNDYRFIDNCDGRFDRYYLHLGDLVFTRYNGSIRYVGVCAEYRSKERRLFPDKLIQTRLITDTILSSYVEKSVNCGESRRYIESKIRTTAGQAGISGSDVKGIPLPLCSKYEQKEIVELLDEKLSVIEKNEEFIDLSLQEAEALRQSILKKAFSGQLVPQDPTDEPASQLLARIQAEKSEREAKASKRAHSSRK